MKTKTTLPGPSSRLRVALHAASISEIHGLVFPTPHVILFLAVDGRVAGVEEFGWIAEQFLSKGVVVACTWGVHAAQLEAAFDDAALKANPRESDHDVIITTSHPRESLEEAAAFALDVIEPADAFKETCRAVVAVALGNRRWYQRLVKAVGLRRPSEA